MSRLCPSCGSLVEDSRLTFCPHCGVNMHKMGELENPYGREDDAYFRGFGVEVGKHWLKFGDRTVWFYSVRFPQVRVVEVHPRRAPALLVLVIIEGAIFTLGGIATLISTNGSEGLVMLLFGVVSSALGWPFVLRSFRRRVYRVHVLSKWGAREVMTPPFQTEEAARRVASAIEEATEDWEARTSTASEAEPAIIEKPTDQPRGIPSNVRAAVLDRDDYICRYCGRRSQTMEVDHVIPASQGGKSTLDNLVTACRDCNRKKAGRTPEEAGMEVLPVRTRRRN